MIIPHKPTAATTHKYVFRNKIIKSDEWTIRQLNYALALNGKSDRYTLYRKIK